jgi:hypothetical protein
MLQPLVAGIPPLAMVLPQTELPCQPCRDAKEAKENTQRCLGYLQHSAAYSAPASLKPAFLHPAVHLAIVISPPGTVFNPYVSARPEVPSLRRR